MDLITEGVFVLASSRALQNAYADSDFDYRFPEGLEELLGASSIIALTTNEADEVSVKIQVSDDFPSGTFDAEINQHIILQENDELLVLSHATFTVICDSHNGDSSSYPIPAEMRSDIPAGIYKINVAITAVTDPEEEDFLASYKVLATLMPVTEIRWSNDIVDFNGERR